MPTSSVKRVFKRRGVPLSFFASAVALLILLALAAVVVELNEFDGHGGGFTAADANASDAAFATAILQRGDQRRQDACT